MCFTQVHSSSGVDTSDDSIAAVAVTVLHQIFRLRKIKEVYIGGAYMYSALLQMGNFIRLEMVTIGFN